MVVSKNKKQTKNTKGFTLVELLVSVALLSVVIGLSTDIIITLVRTNTRTQAANEVEQITNFIFLKLQNDIKNSVSAQATGNNRTLRLTKRNGYRITYQVDNTTAPTSFTWQDQTGSPVSLLDVDAERGVAVECAGSCFQVTSAAGVPDRVDVNLHIFQVNAPVGSIFAAEDYISDTFTVRGSY
ncbi:prepilin-type N-terminal cleavage/methylation domain-containing protein [candidate division WWE3 bacterium]|nr:prepilin-type N-terminal cleavage/methylation domain-containing protein [candidate division WWE3 bacterium]